MPKINENSDNDGNNLDKEKDRKVDEPSFNPGMVKTLQERLVGNMDTLAIPPTQRPSTETKSLTGKLSSVHQPTQGHRAECKLDAFTQRTLNVISILDRLYNTDHSLSPTP